MINVGQNERVISLIGGGVLTLLGVLRGSVEGLAMAILGGGLAYRGATGHSAFYRRVGINTHRGSAGRSASALSTRGIRVEKTVTISRQPEELYRFWRNFENLPRIMRHVEAVRIIDPQRSSWSVSGPGGVRVEWEAILIQEKENELIAWRSVEGSEVETAGSVHFRAAPGGRGTEVKAVLRYDPPGGRAGVVIAKLMGEDPDRQIEEDLRHFKQIMEAGEIPTAVAFDTTHAAHA